MTKVYVVSETLQHNIASALDYGPIETILPPNAQIAFSVAPTVRRIQRKLDHPRHAQPEAQDHMARCRGYG